MSRHTCSALVTLLVVLVMAAPATAAVITFTGDALGPRGNGFQSVDSAVVAFSSTAGNMAVTTTSECLASPCLVTVGVAQTLFLDAAAPFVSLSLLFGNDLSSPGAVYFGELTLFRLGMQVGQVSVQANNNDLVDQLIAFSGAPFDRAAFRLTNGFAPLVDTITFETVPEPATALLLSGALLAAGLRRSRLRQRG